MKRKILINKNIAEDAVQLLKKEYNVVQVESLNPQDPKLVQELKDTYGIIGSDIKITEELLNVAPLLKAVSTVSVGFDSLNVPELTKRGILATNTPDVLTETTADAVFGLLLAAARRISELDRYVKEGHWTNRIPESLFGVNVHGKTLGITGMGRIGKAIAKRANKGFGMKIIYHNRSRDPEAEAAYDAEYSSLDGLLKKSDFVCAMTPLTPETYRMFGKEEFRAMKRSAVFVNGSRGSVVNEHALYEALKNKEIHAAGLDVFEKEPVDHDSPMLQLDNVITLPHIGSATLETRRAMAMLAAENILKSLAEEAPPNLLNPEAVGKAFGHP
ncbi:D-glycerate dehydrogenase [Evansella sp. LMS18]|uniref:2-hydroxyacid dehydrogenase n=1 Tax=Evansella sp. LMS18 TaxID=2924033 RepID=UPI0020D1A692|nr:D-glycerate dehydrogenase [Evansella sp. LMS18]UTR11925.1 D-glycerate dehydrogenase [Evansella sp. LMS18]